ncbi:MAG: hypothetical protein NTW10_02685 [Bacteroidetes bacterium]|nr:hypothetical protein [Bacteroidota bacterium]
MEIVNCKNCGTDNPTTSKYCSGCGYELPRIKTENLNESLQQKTTKNKDKRKQVFGVIIGIIAFGLSYFAVQQIFFKTPSFDKGMMNIASELNKTCPIMVDAETRLDNAIALPGNIFQYNYTLVNIDKANADTLSMKNYLGPSITNFVKTNPQMKFQRDHKTTMNYYYKDKNGVYLFIISVTPDKYK